MAQAESPTEPTFSTDERVIDFETAVEATHIATDDPESHREADPSTWHPSQLAATCDRQAYLSKLDLTVPHNRGALKGGELMHRYMETEVAPRLRAEGRTVAAEQSVEVEVGGITITGTADLVDVTEGVVYDYKTRGSWYYYDGAAQRHRDQIHLIWR